MKMRHVALCLSLLMAALPSQAAELIKLTPAQQQSMNIQTAGISKTTTVFGKPLPAQVVTPPAQMRMITAPQAGMLEQLNVAVGDRVSQGQPLARMQSPDLIALQRDFLQAATQLRLAGTSLRRDDSLLNDGVISQRRQQETQSRHQELSAAVEERRQALQLAGMSSAEINRLEKTKTLSPGLTVNSPISGVILETKAEAGQRLMVSDPIYRIAALKPLWLEIRAPLEQVSQLTLGATGRVQSPAVDSKLITIGRGVDPATQTVLLRAEVTNGAEQLRPGQYVQVALSASTPQTSYQVSGNAVVRSGRQTVVFVQTAQGFEARQVVVLGKRGTQTIVSGELRGNERVAITGLAAIKGAWMGLGGGE